MERSSERAPGADRVHGPDGAPDTTPAQAPDAARAPDAAQASDAARAPDGVVRIDRDGDVLVVTIDNPPVNALGVAVRRGLMQAIDAAEADAAVRAVVLTGAGANFLGGADIREFGRPRLPPSLPEVCNRIEACGKPVVAAIHGAALGGGLEVALAAHARVALPDARLGLPEVTLGLMPGAGGTLRAPRLAGVGPALDMMLTGAPVDAQRAHALGLVHRVATEGDARAAGIALAREWLAAGTPPQRTRDRTDRIADRDAANAALAEARAGLPKKYRGLFSPARIVDAVEAGIERPADDALAFERELFLQCIDSPQRSGLIHAFFAERDVAKVPEATQAAPRPVESVGIVGGGTMGAGIAVAMLDAGLPVTMVERDDDSLARGRANVERVYDAAVARGRMTQQARDGRLARLTGATSYDALATADLVVEAVFEDMAVKTGVMQALDRVCRPGAVLGTNTSYLDVDALAAATSRPQDVIGLHFFSPANVMKLLEIVVPARVSADVVATAFALARRLRKVPVRAGVCDGFIGNRILAVYRQAADHMLEDGASPYRIDRAIRDFGYPMGPFQVSDLAGGDIGWATRKRRAATRDPAARYVQIADRLCERGWFGQKTQRGWYRYDGGARSGTEDPEVLAIVDAERERAGRVPREFSDDEIRRRYLAAMINEGANVVHEGIALRPLDVDVTMINGYGFPRHEGGPMHYADRIGLPQILADIRAFAAEDPRFWTPSPLLVDLVARGAGFASLNSSPNPRSPDA